MIDKLIADNAGLIYSIASRFYSESREDLYQTGVLGLLKAYRNYDKTSGVKFSTYAFDYIYGEMYNYVNKKLIKVNKKLLKVQKLIEKGREILFERNGKEPSDREIMTFLEIPEKLYFDALNANFTVSWLEDDLSVNPKYEENFDNHIFTKELLDNLDEKERKIIVARYFEDLTQMQTAKKLDMTQVMVSRYEKRSLCKMRALV